MKHKNSCPADGHLYEVGSGNEIPECQCHNALNEKREDMPDVVYLDWLGNWYSVDISPQADKLFHRQRYTRADDKPTDGKRAELLPCPMCGKDARVFKEGKNYMDRPLYHVGCKRSRCKVRTPNQLHPSKAITVWNTRADDKNMDGKASAVDMLSRDNARMRMAGLHLAEAAIYVIREFDGTHRLSLAVAEWQKAIADEGDRAALSSPDGMLMVAVEALEKISARMPDSDGDYYDGWAYECKLIAEEACATIKGAATRLDQQKQGEQS